ncbi:ATP-binding protein [Paenibacillus sp. FSL R5-0636]
MNQSNLWKLTLGKKGKGEDQEPLERLRSAFNTFRANCEVLAADITNDLPYFTVHDITHIDSLWEMAGLIVGDDYPINPAEAFVLGGAILLHDLGLASAAYAEGIDKLQVGKEWDDCLETFLINELKRKPTKQERAVPSESVKKNATEFRLRQLHAIHAEKLLTFSWKTVSGKSYKLLNDDILLEHFAEAIGQIAASHWWSIEEVSRKFPPIPIGSSPTLPASWSVDLLKIACIIRCADASHIDSRRAPGLLKAIRKPVGESEKHWGFQEKLARPIVDQELLVYSSTQRFLEKNVDEWWLAYDAIKMIDKELRNVDNLLRNTNKQRFQVKGVLGAESPTRLSTYIKADSWSPVDTTIHISNIPSLVSNLGGEGLYGQNPYIPLRELIQNARDAVVARRKFENKSDSWGNILISYGKDIENNYWIEVEDNGIGMTEITLTDILLDFGKSYWSSDLMMREHPGLLSSGFSSVGKFGIGFYSVFMWSSRIEVTTRSVHYNPDETTILYFSKGLGINPIIKKVNPGNGMYEPGTKIKIFLDKLDIVTSITEYLLHRNAKELSNMNDKLNFICCKLAPALDVDLSYKVFDDIIVHNVIKANDWRTLDNTQLILRSLGFSKEICPKPVLDFVIEHKDFLTEVLDKNGNLIGRVGLVPLEYSYLEKYDYQIACAIITGGIFAGYMQKSVGIVNGSIINASRNHSVPNLEGRQLKKWVAQQATLYFESSLTEESKNHIAESILSLNGESGKLPICQTSRGWMSFEDIASIKSWPNKISFLRPYEKNNLINLARLSDDCILVDSSHGSFLPFYSSEWPSAPKDNILQYGLLGLTIKAVAQSKGININLLNKRIKNKHLLIDEPYTVGFDVLGNEIIYKTDTFDFSNL